MEAPVVDAFVDGGGKVTAELAKCEVVLFSWVVHVLAELGDMEGNIQTTFGHGVHDFPDYLAVVEAHFGTELFSL